jgi:hypothetical protein
MTEYYIPVDGGAYRMVTPPAATTPSVCQEELRLYGYSVVKLAPGNNSALGYQNPQVYFPNLKGNSIQLKMKNQEDKRATKLFDIGSRSHRFSESTTPEDAEFRCAVVVAENVIRQTAEYYLLPLGNPTKINVNIFGLRTKPIPLQLPTANNQQFHIDYIPSSEPSHDETLLAHACIVPLLDQGCDLIVVNGSHLVKWSDNDDAANQQILLQLLKTGKARKVHVAKGSAILFHGQLVHAGASYTTPNDRLFTYIAMHSSHVPQDSLGMAFPMIFGLTATHILLSPRHK